MKKIILNRLTISNFKGIHALEVDFTERTNISGENGSGKSTIQDAFYWCLFGVNAQGTTSFTVRPLDNNNSLISDLEVKVSVTLECDNIISTFTRVLSAGKKDNSATYCVNDVPCKMAEFKSKLNDICLEDDLKLLTSIYAFTSLDTKTARIKLQQIAGTVSDSVIAQQFPAILQAFSERKTVEEFKREVSAKKAKSIDRLKQIPTAINAQEALRPTDINFDLLRSNATSLEAKIKRIDDQLQNLTDSNSDDYITLQKEQYVLHSLKSDLLDVESSIYREYKKRQNELESQKSDIDSVIIKSQRELAAIEIEVKDSDVAQQPLAEKLNGLKTKWSEVNEKLFDASVEPFCPNCKKPYTQVELSEMSATQIEQFNEWKLSELKTIEKQYADVKLLHDNHTNSKNETVEKINTLNTLITSNKKALAECAEKSLKLPTAEQAKAANTECQKLAKDIELQSLKVTTLTPKENKTNQNLQEDKQKHQQELATINKELGKESLNGDIDKLKSNLLVEEITLAQAVADCENIENQIKEFGKRKIEMVEDAVSSLFEIVKFKMYESNISNDGEKEICECLVDGVPYSNLNTAMKVNAGIDIVNGLSKGLGITTPIWIDNKESVLELINTPAQLITLEVVANQTLSIN